MGLDGRQRLEIRGPKESLDALEDSGLVLEGGCGVEELDYIASRFFGNDLVNVVGRDDNCLVVSYEFRNRPVYQYLSHILRAYPKCWMKNEFSSDGGYCGLWIASMVGENIAVQELEWEEPCIEEKCFGSDFSRP